MATRRHDSFLTSPIDVQSLLSLLSLDGFVQQDDGFFVESFRKALHRKVIIGQQQLTLSLQVDGALFVVIGFIKCQQVVIDGSIEITQTSL